MNEPNVRLRRFYSSSSSFSSSSTSFSDLFFLGCAMRYYVQVVGAIALFFVVTVSCCVYNSECGNNARCRDGVCIVEQCRTAIDCLPMGLYFQCDSNRRCAKSKHKICRSNADCKKNKKCVNYKCA